MGVMVVGLVGAMVQAAPTGSVELRADGPCKLEVNGRPQGNLAPTQARVLKLPIGPANVRCSSSDWPSVSATIAVDVRSDASTVATLRLRWSETPDGLLDRHTRLEWTRSDNGADLDWVEAGAHCAALGASWRLPSRDELQGLFGSSAHGETTPCRGASCKVPGLFQLSSYWQWTGQADPDGRQAWYLYLHTGHPQQSRTDYRLGARALCVRAVR